MYDNNISLILQFCTCEHLRSNATAILDTVKKNSYLNINPVVPRLPSGDITGKNTIVSNFTLCSKCPQYGKFTIFGYFTFLGNIIFYFTIYGNITEFRVLPD